jgi:1-acyl-sn-glycerol-3-phosphate acyltransferase
LKRDVRLLRNDFTPNGKPTIYAATHVFYDDIAAVCCCLEQPAYLLLGIESSDNTPTFSERIALGLNGVIVVNRADKGSRTEAFDKMVAVLRKGGNVLMFPEGSWNLTPNLLVQKLHWGAIKVAEQSNANVVPVAVDIVDDDYYVIIGENFGWKKYTTYEEATIGLRDAMAALVWELISLKQQDARNNLEDSHWLNHIKAQYARMPRKNQLKEESYVFRPKDETSLGELLAELHGIPYRSMAADYKVHKQIDVLINNWTK